MPERKCQDCGHPVTRRAKRCSPCHLSTIPKRASTVGLRSVMKNGYVRITLAAGERVYEHRWVWEQANGSIPAGGVVHHHNGDKTDNRIENLGLSVSQSSHHAEHGGNTRWGAGRPYCSVCGGLKDGVLTSGYRYCKACNRRKVAEHKARKASG